MNDDSGAWGADGFLRLHDLRQPDSTLAMEVKLSAGPDRAGEFIQGKALVLSTRQEDDCALFFGETFQGPSRGFRMGGDAVVDNQETVRVGKGFHPVGKPGPVGDVSGHLGLRDSEFQCAAGG